MINKRIRKDIVILVLNFGVLVLAQSRFLVKNAGYGIFNKFDIRGIMGASAFQLFLLISVFIILNIFLKKSTHFNNRRIKSTVTFIIIINIISMLLFTKNIAAGIRTVIIYNNAVIYFVIFSMYRWNLNDIKKFIKIGGIIFFINLITGYYQWIYKNYTVDNLQGLVDDAHQFSLLMYAGALYFITKYLVFKNKKYIYISFLPIVIALIASNDKATIFFILTVITILILHYKISFKTILIFLFSILLSSMVTSYTLKNLLTKEKSVFGGLNRFYLLENIGNVAEFIKLTAQYNAYMSVPNIYIENLPSIFFGVGPTQFGSEEVDLTSKYSKIAHPNSTVSLLGTNAFSKGTSFILVILIEFGFICFLLYIYIFHNIIKFLLNYKKSKNNLLKHLMLWLLSYMFMLLFLSIISTRESFAGSTNTILYFSILGILFNTNYTNKINENSYSITLQSK